MAVVTQATTPAQGVLETTLGAAAVDADSAGIGAPAIVCIGDATLMRRALDWQALAQGEPLRDSDPLGLGPAEGA